MDSSVQFPPPPPEGASLSLAEVRALNAPATGPTGDLPERTQVIIVGAGPAGLTAANLLGRMGIATLLLESKKQTADMPKATAIDDEYMRMLVRLDLWPAMKGHYSHPFGIWFVGADGMPVVQVPGSVTANGFGRRSAVMQPVFEKILLAGAQRYPNVCVRYDHIVEAITQDAGAVSVRVNGRLVLADYLLGCDGIRSFVRTSLGIAFVGSQIDQPHLVLDLAAFDDHSPYSRFFCNPVRPVNSVPSTYGVRRLEFMLNDDDDHDEIISDASIRRLVDEHTPYRGTELHVIRKAIYGFAERIADRLQDGRIFLLGDAAHVMPPFGGQGMNTAARDVNNLGWKIAAVLAGKSSPALLDTYDSERRKQIRAIIDYSVLIGKFANVRSHWGARLRDLFFRTVQRVPAIRSFLSDMRYMPPPSIDDGVILSADKNRARFVGRPFPRLLLEKNGREVPIDDLFGEGFTLVGIGIETHILEQAAQHPLWQRWGVAQVSIGTAGSPKLAASSPTAEQLHNSICVVRPDLYIAATMAPANMNRAFDRIAALLAVPSDQDARG